MKWNGETMKAYQTDNLIRKSHHAPWMQKWWNVLDCWMLTTDWRSFGWPQASEVITDDVMLILRHAAPALPWEGAWPETDDGREQWLGPGRWIWEIGLGFLHFEAVELGWNYPGNGGSVWKLWSGSPCLNLLKTSRSADVMLVYMCGWF